MSRVALLVSACSALLALHKDDTGEITRVKSDLAIALAKPVDPAAETVSEEEKRQIDDLLNQVAAATAPRQEAVEVVAESVPTVTDLTPVPDAGASGASGPETVGP